jgi:hypothetical protein
MAIKEVHQHIYNITEQIEQNKIPETIRKITNSIENNFSIKIINFNTESATFSAEAGDEHEALKIIDQKIEEIQSISIQARYKQNEGSGVITITYQKSKPLSIQIKLPADPKYATALRSTIMEILQKSPPTKEPPQNYNLTAENLPNELQVGLIINETYELVEILGEGASGEVWKVIAKKATSIDGIRKGDTYAVKFYKDWVLTNQEHFIRVPREFLTSKKNPNQNLIKLFHFNISNEKHHTFLVMEYIEGKMFSDIIPENGFEKNYCIEMGIKLLNAVRSLHRTNIIHRDIKVENVMLDQNGTLKLLDYGIVMFENENTITNTGDFLGSKRTSPLEQHMGNPTKQSDIYSVGAFLFHLYSGKGLFHDERNVARIWQRLFTNDLPQIQPKTHQDRTFIDTINSFLVQNPSSRPSSCDNAIELLENSK